MQTYFKNHMKYASCPKIEAIYAKAAYIEGNRKQIWVKTLITNANYVKTPPFCKVVSNSVSSMAVLIGVHHGGALPAEDEVTRAGTEHQGQTQPDVVGHEDQHQAVGDEHLDHVE